MASIDDCAARRPEIRLEMDRLGVGFPSESSGVRLPPIELRDGFFCRRGEGGGLLLLAELDARRDGGGTDGVVAARFGDALCDVRRGREGDGRLGVGGAEDVACVPFKDMCLVPCDRLASAVVSVSVSVAMSGICGGKRGSRPFSPGVDCSMVECEAPRSTTSTVLKVVSNK